MDCPRRRKSLRPLARPGYDLRFRRGRRRAGWIPYLPPDTTPHPRGWVASTLRELAGRASAHPVCHSSCAYSTASMCYFCLWDGYGWLQGGPAVAILTRRGSNGAPALAPALSPEQWYGPRVRLQIGSISCSRVRSQLHLSSARPLARPFGRSHPTCSGHKTMRGVSPPRSIFPTLWSPGQSLLQKLW